MNRGPASPTSAVCHHATDIGVKPLGHFPCSRVRPSSWRDADSDQRAPDHVGDGVTACCTAGSRADLPRASTRVSHRQMWGLHELETVSSPNLKPQRSDEQRQQPSPLLCRETAARKVFWTVQTEWSRLVRMVSACHGLQAAFHHSSQLQTWLQTWFSTRFAARFSTSSCGFATRFRPAFDFICRKPGRELQQVRWFVRVLDKWNIEKTRFKQVRSWLSTCFRPACDQVFDQVCSWLE